MIGGMHRYGDDELELYELVRKFEYNATQISKKLCKKDCKRAAKVQAEEARKKYVEEYEEWEKRQSWAKELGYEEHVPITAEEVEAKRKEIAEEKKQRRKTGAPLPSPPSSLPDALLFSTCRLLDIRDCQISARAGLATGGKKKHRKGDEL